MNDDWSTRPFAGRRLALAIITLLPFFGSAHPAAAQDRRGAKALVTRSPVASVSTQSGYTSWRLDVNSDCLFSDHNYMLDIPADPAQMSDITYTMTNFDVDYNDPQGCTGGPEVDIMHFNNANLGILTGANNSWSLNSWPLASSQLVRGSNSIFVDTDSTATGCWCVGVGYIEVKAKLNFQVSSFTPADLDKNRDFHAGKLDLRVKFNADYDPATVTTNTFKLEYLDASSARQQVAGTFTQVGPQEFRFVPGADLKDGVRYRVTLVNGPNGIKAKAGAELNQQTTWSFWTVPNLDLTDAFNYGSGSVCPPSVSPCPGLELAVFQVARNRDMIPQKDAVARLYLRWKPHSDVAPGEQVTEMDVEAQLNLASGAVQQRVKRPDKYSASEIATARQTVNIVHKPANNFSYSVKVTPRPQTNAAVVEYSQTKALNNHGSSPRLSYDYYTLKDGLWSGGVPSGVQPASSSLLTSGDQLITDLFPVLGTSHNDRGELTFGYTTTGTMLTEPGCGAIREVNCPFLIFFSRKRSEYRCIQEKMSSMLGGHPLVAVTVPDNLCQGATAFALGKVFMHQFGTGANDGTIAHEVGHVFGISLANSPNRAHRNSSIGVEGFQVRTGVNRSNTENPSKAISLMHTIVQPAGTQWIHNDDYDTLLGTVKRMTKARLAAGRFLIVTGTINTTSHVVELAPAFLQEVPNDPLAETGECLVELLDNGNHTLSSTHVDPGVELFLAARDGREMQGHKQAVTEDRFFSASLPWDAAARKVRVGCQGAVYLEKVFSAHAPQVTLTQPSVGATLTGTVEIAWSGSDADGPQLAYQLQLSPDGETWTPLGPLATETHFTLDTSRLASDEEAFLRVMVTDGFNTAYDTRQVGIKNPLRVVATQPAAGQGGVPPFATVSALFATPLNADLLSLDSLQVIDPVGSRVAGAWSLSDEDRMLVFKPGLPLFPSTEYRAVLSPDLEDVLGNTLGTSLEWTFSTGRDETSPSVISPNPAPSEVDIPIDSLIQATFDDAMDPATLDSSSFQLLDAQSSPLAGTVEYDQFARRAVFRPAHPLAANSEYRARITPAALDLAGNALATAYEWTFSTSSSAHGAVRITGNFNDVTHDSNGDHRFDDLTVLVEVEVRHNGTYNLNGRLLDKNGRLIGWATSGDIYLEAGYHSLALVYPAAPIRSNGVDGPYFLTSLNFYTVGEVAVADPRLQAYQTSPYPVDDFFAALIFGNLPDQVLATNPFRDHAFNLRSFTSHATLPVGAIHYQVFSNSDPRIQVTIDQDANVNIHPDPNTEA